MLRPHEFDSGPDAIGETPDGTAPKWEFGGFTWIGNPRRGITEDHRLAVDSYAMSRDSMGGSAFLPFAGGALEQPALLMDAWKVIGRIWRECTEDDA